jgi:DNA replicative helicase MCM subunit Mcm2 (Cdc46/Mcm family)
MAEFYRDTRQRSQQPGSHLPVTTRLLEASIRLATAHAKLKLHTTVTKEDVDVAKKMILSSRNEEAEAEIPGAAAVEAPAGEDDVFAKKSSREEEFRSAAAMVAIPNEGLPVADFITRLNQNLRPGVQAFDEAEAKPQLDALEAANRIALSGDKVLGLSG